MQSPVTTSEILVSTLTPFFDTSADVGCKFINWLILSEVFERARDSSHRPIRTRPMIAAATSKYVPVEWFPPMAALVNTKDSSNMGRRIVTAAL